MMDGEIHELLDIHENRQFPYLERYFIRFPIETRQSVQFIVIDIYSP